MFVDSVIFPYLSDDVMASLMECQDVREVLAVIGSDAWYRGDYLMAGRISLIVSPPPPGVHISLYDIPNDEGFIREVGVGLELMTPDGKRAMRDAMLEPIGFPS